MPPGRPAAADLPAQGYSLTYALGPDSSAPRTSLSDVHNKVVYARLGDRLRVAGMVDIGDRDAGIDGGRIHQLKEQVRRYLPRLAPAGEPEAWAGLRPARPDGKPLIGRTPVRGLWINAGHGALGFTLAAGSAGVLADRIAGRPSPISDTLFSGSREQHNQRHKGNDMKQTRRLRQGAGALLLALAAALAPAAQGQAQTVTAVMQSGLRVLDPVMTTAFMTRDHGYMIYDTLLGTDEHFKVQPQMASWTESEDRKTYVFTLRDGLKWHDGAPVTSEDCIASIKRWADADATGQVLMTLIDRIEAVDAKQFRVVLKQPTSLLLEGLAKLSSRPLFMMPKRIADTPSAQPITEFIGSGPFKFVASEFKPGLKVVYEKNKDYVPRAEPPSWTAGGKVVKVERVEWVAMPDQMTAVSALQNGEVDFMQQVPFDLLPMVEGQDNLQVRVLDKLGPGPTSA